MNNIGKQLEIRPDLIEEYLFGTSRKDTQNWNDNNPRKKLEDYILNHESCVIKQRYVNKFNGKKTRETNSQKGKDQKETVTTFPEDSINKFRDKFSSHNLLEIKKIKGGPNVELAVRLSDGHILAVGAKKRFVFCGLYSGNGAFVNPYPDEFDNSRASGYFRKHKTLEDALRQFEKISNMDNPNSSKTMISNFTKEAIETGEVPVMDLLRNSVYYPACGIDGRPIKRFNPLYSEYGINSYVYTDYAVGNELLLQKQDTFKHYHVFAARDLKRTDLYTGSMDFSRFESLLTKEEETEYRDTIMQYAGDIKIFGKWIVYERNSDAGEEVGAQRFSLLYIGGEGVATYAALFLSKNIAPCILTIIAPGAAFGGNYSCFRSILSKIVDSGEQLPKYYFFGSSDSAAADCKLVKYEKGILTR